MRLQTNKTSIEYEKATLLRRYKRFLSDVKLKSGEVVVAHVPNSGSMLGVSTPGSPCLVSHSQNPKRKLKFGLEFVQVPSGTWVGINTAQTNRIVERAYLKKTVPHWRDYSQIKSEIKINSSTRLDFVLTSPIGKLLYVEVKNISMSEPPIALFPDAKTERGLKHLKELVMLKEQGHGAEIFFVVQRNDCDRFRPAEKIDPLYAEGLRLARKAGVTVSCWACEFVENRMELSHPLKIDF